MNLTVKIDENLKSDVLKEGMIFDDTITNIQAAINDRPIKLLNWNASSDTSLVVLYL